VARLRAAARVTATVAIRRGERSDRPFVLELGKRVAGTSVSSLRAAFLPLVESAFRTLAEYVWTRDHDMLVAEEGGKPVGFVLVVHDLPDEVSLTEQVFIAYMAVAPEWQRRGIGRAMLGAVERLAEERGVEYVSLMVTEENTPARGLYDAAGFTTERRMLTKRVES
jgi:ribosomal protein S18 acetylase RimI-like enzyme